VYKNTRDNRLLTIHQDIPVVVFIKCVDFAAMH